MVKPLGLIWLSLGLIFRVYLRCDFVLEGRTIVVWWYFRSMSGDDFGGERLETMVVVWGCNERFLWGFQHGCKRETVAVVVREIWVWWLMGNGTMMAVLASLGLDSNSAMVRIFNSGAISAVFYMVREEDEGGRELGFFGLRQNYLSVSWDYSSLTF